MLLSDEAKDRVIILIKEDKYEEPIFGPNGY